METTIGNSNPDLWKYVSLSALFEGISIVIANRPATVQQLGIYMYPHVLLSFY